MLPAVAGSTDDSNNQGQQQQKDQYQGSVMSLQQHTWSPASWQLSPRPFWLVDAMRDSPLKQQLSKCMNYTTNYKTSDFSIGHRGAGLIFPEHTKESYLAAPHMGAGIC
jgi:glycerophosphoryl diester phosphodiesterase